MKGRDKGRAVVERQTSTRSRPRLEAHHRLSSAEAEATHRTLIEYPVDDPDGTGLRKCLSV